MPGNDALADAVGVDFEQRWQRFDEAVGLLRALQRGAAPSTGGRFYPVPEARLSPLPADAAAIPLWIGSWGSTAGLRRVARVGDGWLPSAYNINPAGFAAGLDVLRSELRAQGRAPDPFPHAVVTMWTWITENAREADRVLEDRLAPDSAGRDRAARMPGRR